MCPSKRLIGKPRKTICARGDHISKRAYVDAKSCPFCEIEKLANELRIEKAMFEGAARAADKLRPEKERFREALDDIANGMYINESGYARQRAKEALK